MSQTERLLEKRRPTLLQISLTICGSFSLMVSLLMVFFVIPSQTAVVEDRLDEAARRSLSGLGTTIIDPLLTRQYEFMYYRIDTQLNADANWLRIRVRDRAGEQLYPLGEWHPELLDTQRLITEPIGTPNNELGTIELVIDHEAAVAESLKLTYIMAFILFLLIAITMIVVIVFLQAAISKPVIGLTTAFKQMQEGDFESELPYARSREVSFLVLEFFRFRRATEDYQKNLIQLKEAAEQANAAKSQFMSRMSHELRTPLNSVLGFSEIGLNSDSTPRDQRRQFEAINQSGQHLLDLVNETLDLSRLETGKLQVELQPVYIPDMLDQCQAMTTYFAESHEVSLAVLPIAPDVCCVLADPVRLKQVLINLISNAVKYNRKGGRVYLEVAGQGSDKVAIRVRDTGIGFDSEEKDKIFSPFERLAKSANSVDGTGIGLSISQRLVELMGGQIEVQSVDGVGSEFSVILDVAVVPEDEAGEIMASACCPPLARKPQQKAPPDEAEPSALSATSSSEKPGAGLRILVAEDNEINQLLFKTQLESLGYHCTLSCDGVEAMAALEEATFDILLTDISMPEMGGLELTKKIRAGHSALGELGAELPIIACSANAMNEDQINGAAAGVDAYLTKPFQKAQLQEVLSEAYQARQSAPA